MEQSSAKAWDSYRRADPGGQFFRQLQAYGQFCDLMPRVRKGYFEVAGDARTGFTLSVAEDIVPLEERETIINELAQEVVLEDWPRLEAATLAAFLASLPALNRPRLVQAMQPYYQCELRALVEPVPITPEGFVAASRATLDEYRRFRSGWAALACIYDALARHVAEETGSVKIWERHRLRRVYHGLYCVLLRKDFAFSVVKEVSQLDDEVFASLLDFFSIDASSPSALFDKMGDRFFPPILLMRDDLMFNPRCVRSMICMRNLLYALLKQDENRFNKTVSQHMEPHLIAEAAREFQRVRSYAVVSNIKWRSAAVRGEIDMLVYHPAENIALHIQAKGVLPPMGARMERAVENRFIGGIEQLDRFRKLAQTEQDRIISQSLGMAVRDATVLDVLLTRTCFGGGRIWKRFQDKIALNTAILRAVMTRKLHSKNVALANFAFEVDELTTRIEVVAEPRWIPSRLRLGDTLIQGQELDFNDRNLSAARRVVWAD